MAKKRPINSSSSHTVNRLEELSRKYTERTENPSAAEEDILSSIGTMQELKEGLTSGRFSSQKIGYDIATANERIEELYQRMDPIESRRINVAGRAYASGISTALRPSNISRDINAMAMSASMVGQASTMTKYSTSELEGMKSSASANLIRTGTNIIEAAQGDPSNPQISNMMRGMGGQIQETAAIQAALNLQRRTGQDVRSRYLNTMERAASLRGMIESEDLSRDVGAGKYGSRSDVESTLRQNLGDIDRFRGAQERHSGDPSKFERFQRAIDKLTASAEGAAKTLKEMDRQGAGGGGGGGFLSMISNPKLLGGAMLVSQALSAAGDAASAYGVELPQRQRLNQASFAGLGTNQASDMMAAAGGDAGAIRRMTSGWGAANDASASAQSWTRGKNILLGAGQMLGGAAGTIGGSVLAAGGGAISLTGAGATVGIPASWAGGVLAAGGMTLAARGFRNIVNFNEEAGEAGSSAARAELAKQDALSKVSDDQMQSYMGYSRSVGANTVGSGGRRGAIFNQMNSQSEVDLLASLGVDPSRAAGAAGAGIASMGSGFNTRMVSRGAEMRRGGYMSEEQYMNNVGSLSNFGSVSNSTSNLEGILKNAIANGMDSSKNIAQMVQLTGSMAARSAAAGVDTITGSTKVMGNIMDSLKAAGVDPNARAVAGANQMNWMSNTMTDTSYDIGNVSRFASAGGITQNAAQRARLATLSPEQFQQIRSGGRAAASQFGLGNVFYDEQGKFKEDVYGKAVGAAVSTMQWKVSGGGLSPGARKAMGTYGPLADAEQQELNAAQSLSGIASLDFQGILNKDPSKGGIAGPSGNVAAIESMNSSGALAAARQQQDARLNTSLETLSKSMEKFVSEMDFKEINKSIKAAADEYKVPAQDLKDAANALNAAASQLSGIKR